MYSLEPLTEHNIADSCAKEMNDSVYRYPEDRMGKVAAAIWPWKCKNARFCYNEVTDTRLNQDGMALLYYDRHLLEDDKFDQSSPTDNLPDSYNPPISIKKIIRYYPWFRIGKEEEKKAALN